MTAGETGVRELAELLRELEELLKNSDVLSELADRGVNSSLALVAGQALGAYLQGNKAQAAEDFALVAEEIRARLGPGATH